MGNIKLVENECELACLLRRTDNCPGKVLSEDIKGNCVLKFIHCKFSFTRHNQS